MKYIDNMLRPHSQRVAKTLAFFMALNIFGVCFFSGCAISNKDIRDDKSSELSTTGFAFNTTYTINLYEGGNKDILNQCVSMCAKYETIFSRTLKGSELYNINEIESYYIDYVKKSETISAMWSDVLNPQEESGKTDKKSVKSDIKMRGKYTPRQIIDIDNEINRQLNIKNDIKYKLNKNGTMQFELTDDFAKLLERGIYYSELAEGSFDITIAPVSSLWDFTADEPQVPQESSISEALKYVEYENMTLNGKVLTLKIPGMGIDLGAIAKGFIADELKKYLVSSGVKSGTISLGGNVLCIGKKTDGSPFRIGVQQPFAERNEIITAVGADDVSVVSSGVYERYFEYGDTIYHHILNPKTGYSYDNGLVAVTIVSDESIDGDGLSTTCFALGTKKGLELVNSMDRVEAVFITDDQKLHYSDGFKKLEI